MSKPFSPIPVFAIAVVLILTTTVLHKSLASMDRESIPKVIFGFFILALAIVTFGVFSKAYSNWRD